jgi:hypothetical protein
LEKEELFRNSIFFQKKYTAEPSNSFYNKNIQNILMADFSKPLKRYLLFTDIVDDKKKKNKQLQFSEKATKNFEINAKKYLCF